MFLFLFEKLLNVSFLHILYNNIDNIYCFLQNHFALTTNKSYETIPKTYGLYTNIKYIIFRIYKISINISLFFNSK